MNWMTQKFKESDLDTPLLDAQLLLCHVLGFSKIQLYTDYDRPLDVAERGRLRELVQRRLQGEPVAYLVNKKYWYDLELYVDSRVLIPRPETECILDHCHSAFCCDEKRDVPKLIFDFCTGSACLAIALARLFPSAQVVAVDVSQDALDVAALNIKKYDLEKPISLEKCDLNNPSDQENLIKKYGSPQLVVANPPYVTSSEWNSLDLTVKNFEPKLALVDEGDAGLKLAKQIALFVTKLENPVFFMMELSPVQPEVLKVDLQKNHDLKSEVLLLEDLDKNSRFFVLRGE